MLVPGVHLPPNPKSPAIILVDLMSIWLNQPLSRSILDFLFASLLLLYSTPAIQHQGHVLDLIIGLNCFTSKAAVPTTSCPSSSFNTSTMLVQGSQDSGPPTIYCPLFCQPSPCLRSTVHTHLQIPELLLLFHSLVWKNSTLY